MTSLHRDWTVQQPPQLAQLQQTPDTHIHMPQKRSVRQSPSNSEQKRQRETDSLD